MNEQEDLWLEVIAEMEARRQKGLSEYKVPVTSSEVVDWLAHAESEFFDGGIYCRAARKVMERLQERVRVLETENRLLQLEVTTLRDQETLRRVLDRKREKREREEEPEEGGTCYLILVLLVLTGLVLTGFGFLTFGSN